MGSKMVESTKQVRVDNWGIFFLQRLQMFFSKTDFCDLTLQFEGNVQLKVHRLVMNACTEYFTYLEQECPTLEERTIMMPPELQSDVIVPIVNFMYTGMLEFHVSVFEKLYKAAEIMNIAVLIKLLDAQRTSTPYKPFKKKIEKDLPGPKKYLIPKTIPELPPTLPGRKIPVWKRTNIPQHPISQMFYPDKNSVDPLMIHDNTPKPTRFEWPDDDLPPINLMDSSFEDISYTSKPLLTQEEEERIGPSMNTSTDQAKKVCNSGSEKELDNQVALFGAEDYNDVGQKRKSSQNCSKPIPKKVKVNDKENKETTISIKSNTMDLDHTKIVTEILKKYPNLVKKNKNIKLKIMPMSPTKETKEIKSQEREASPKKVETLPEQSVLKEDYSKPSKSKISQEGPWYCHKCMDAGKPQEFILYYLYRKHMTDIHHELFDIRLCKYCGQKCSKSNLMMYHLYTKHGLKPHILFPKCERCPHIALSEAKLEIHKQKHNIDERQCFQCKLAFTNNNTLTAHLQITGHVNNSGKPSHDCQYCTKKLQSPINLLSHIKNSHFKEAKRDGIVSIDELDEGECEENYEEEGGEEDMLVESQVSKDKVKIISNVKVSNRKNQGATMIQDEIEQIQTTSETFNNVTSSIATSLGLVDIVVLDETILQPENSTEQTGFILPELSTGETSFSGQVITQQSASALPQGDLQTAETDIGSTDELVMVLTDHDYQDDQEGENTNNSNIVVLYSHPVDGQGQFITSQGNLLVNSQTGMLEIQDRNTVTTTSNQILVNDNEETQIESIEMIQREIENQSNLKQEPLFEEERKPDVDQALVEHSIETISIEKPFLTTEVVENKKIQNEENENLGSGFEEADDISKTNNDDLIHKEAVEENKEISNNKETVEKPEEEQVNLESNEENSQKNTNDDQVEEDPEKQNVSETQDLVAEHQQEEPMEIEETLEDDVQLNKISDQSKGESELEQTTVVEETVNLNNPESESETKDSTQEQNFQEDNSEKLDISNDSLTNIEVESSPPNVSREASQTAQTEPMQVEESVSEDNVEVQLTKGMNKEDRDETVEENEINTERESSICESTEQIQSNKTEELINKEIISTQFREEQAEESHPNEEDSTFEDSSRLQEISDSSSNLINSNINQTILQDWEEDTDSQHSDKQKTSKKESKMHIEKSRKMSDCQESEKQKNAADNVNRLMDDWDEEEEEK